MSDSVPAGWYPTPDGKQRYWDGEKWTNLPYDDVAPVEEKKAPRFSKRTKLIALGAVLVIVLGAGTAVGVKLKLDSDTAAAAEVAADKALAAQEAEEKRVAEAAATAERLEREARKSAVTGVEASVKTMAEGHTGTGLIDGPIISVGCVPVDGGSTDDLTETTTVFECFVANKDNGDGTLSGYYYNATMNWSTGSYTYGFGQP